MYQDLKNFNALVSKAKFEVLKNTVGIKTKVIVNKLKSTADQLKELSVEKLLEAAIFRDSYKNQVIKTLKE